MKIYQEENETLDILLRQTENRTNEINVMVKEMVERENHRNQEILSLIRSINSVGSRSSNDDDDAITNTTTNTEHSPERYQYVNSVPI